MGAATVRTEQRSRSQARRAWSRFEPGNQVRSKLPITIRVAESSIERRIPRTASRAGPERARKQARETRETRKHGPNPSSRSPESTNDRRCAPSRSPNPKIRGVERNQRVRRGALDQTKKRLIGPNQISWRGGPVKDRLRVRVFRAHAGVNAWSATPPGKRPTTQRSGAPCPRSPGRRSCPRPARPRTRRGARGSRRSALRRTRPPRR